MEGGLTVRTPASRQRGRHPAAASRIVAAGLSASAALAMVATLGLTSTAPASGGTTPTSPTAPAPAARQPGVLYTTPHTTTKGS